MAATPAVPLGTQRKLKALKYPGQLSDLSGPQGLSQLQRIVLWVEEEKIRLYRQDQRGELRSLKDQNAWWNTLTQYLTDLGTSFDTTSNPNNATTRIAIVDRLLTLALQDEYLDAAEGHKLAEAEDAAEEVRGAKSPSKDLQPLVAPINKMLRAFDLPVLEARGEKLTENEVSAALQAVKTRVLLPECKQTQKPNLDIPVGFNAPNKDLKDIAVVLRLLHQRELRELQCRVNETLNDLQQITADPKTNVKLGRVGR